MVRYLFQDRADAGRRLASALSKYSGQDDLLVLGLPRGGVPVAHQVAKALNAPLDIFLVRKLGVPGQEELAMGAIASGGTVVLNHELVRQIPDANRLIDEVKVREQRELERRERAYRGDRPHPDVHDQTVILVDDGLATGASMRAAAKALRAERPAKIVVAVPVAARETCDSFRDVVDEVVCVATPDPFYAVGMWYEDFSETTDDEVRELLGTANVASGSQK
jgi:predicted phosphoribosyltransferase